MLNVRTLCYMCGAHCVTCAVHIVLHVRCTLCYMYSHMLRMRFHAAHVLYYNERFGIVKISRYFSYNVKFDIKTFAGTH